MLYFFYIFIVLSRLRASSQDSGLCTYHLVFKKTNNLQLRCFSTGSRTTLRFSVIKKHYKEVQQLTLLIKNICKICTDEVCIYSAPCYGRFLCDATLELKENEFPEKCPWIWAGFAS